MTINFILFFFYHQFVISSQPGNYCRQKLESSIAPKPNQTFFFLIRNIITKGSVRQSGIYSIPCSSCNLQYIGESDDRDRRLQQHKYDIQKYNRNNPIVKHISVQDHPVNINNATTVKIINNIRQHKAIESFLIKNVKNMNVYQCSMNFDHLISSFLLNNVPSLRKFLHSLNN